MTNSAEAVLTSVILSYLVAWADAPLRAEALAASVVGGGLGGFGGFGGGMGGGGGASGSW
ncbi:hypothetical protein QIU18_08250 [Capnocytophaga canimorsus]|nr:hypothetical protein [Capnocytophaga canimorsus]WGU69666.1 hypothetical protein QIU18_08250 [Capnocytophaga canimorsus]